MTERELQLKNRLARLKSGFDSVTPLGGDKGRLQFLAARKGNIAGMTLLRRLLRESGRRIDVYRLTEDQVVEEIARLIWSGEIELGSGRTWDLGGASKVQAGAPAAPPAASQPSSGSRAPEPESATFPPGLNGATQAATLIAAAASGAPFCPH